MFAAPMLFTLATTALAAEGAFPSIDEPLRTGARAPEDAAVVVGIEDYIFLPDVPYAQRDARAVYDHMIYTRGIPSDRVRLLDSGASREQIVAAVEDVGTSTAAGGTVWVYFAGHGAASPSTGERMLLGDDVRTDIAVFESRGVQLDELRDLAGAGGASVVLMVDACYNGLGRSGSELVGGKRFAVPSYASSAPAGALEWTAAGPDEMSGPLEQVQHGAFTYFALGALRGWADGELDGAPDGVVTAEEANLYVQRALRTVQIHDQRPVMRVEAGQSRVMASGALEAAPGLTARGASDAPAQPTSAPPASGTALAGSSMGVADRAMAKGTEAMAKGTGVAAGAMEAAAGLLSTSELAPPTAGEADFRQLFPGDYDEVYARAVAAADAMRWKVKKQSSGLIVAKTPMSAASWGERVSIMVVPVEGGVEVTVESQATRQLIDWGKSARNVKKFFRTMDELGQ